LVFDFDFWIVSASIEIVSADRNARRTVRREWLVAVFVHLAGERTMVYESPPTAFALDFLALLFLISGSARRYGMKRFRLGCCYCRL